MEITDVRTVLLTGPITGDPSMLEIRKVRSVAMIELHTDTEYIGIGETYAGYFCPEIVPQVVAFYAPILIGRNVHVGFAVPNTCIIEVPRGVHACSAV